MAKDFKTVNDINPDTGNDVSKNTGADFGGDHNKDTGVDLNAGDLGIGLNESKGQENNLHYEKQGLGTIIGVGVAAGLTAVSGVTGLKGYEYNPPPNTDQAHYQVLDRPLSDSNYLEQYQEQNPEIRNGLQGWSQNFQDGMSEWVDQKERQEERDRAIEASNASLRAHEEAGAMGTDLNDNSSGQETKNPKTEKDAEQQNAEPAELPVDTVSEPEPESVEPPATDTPTDTDISD